MMSEDADVTPHCSTKPFIIGQRVSVILSGDSSLALSITDQRVDVSFTISYHKVLLTGTFGNSHV